MFSGDALNVAVDEIDDPRVYGRALEGSKAKIGGETIRNIPLANTRPHQVETAALGDFFSKMDYNDLQKKAPARAAASGQSK